MQSRSAFSWFIIVASVAGALIYLFFAGRHVNSANLSPALKIGSKYPVFWPPRLGEKFPDLHLVDATGASLNLAKFEGKTILIEEIGMSCPACNSFCGAFGAGSGFKGVNPQEGLPSIDDYMSGMGIVPNDPNLIVVDLLLYNMQMQAPSVQDAKEWCDHFKIKAGGNHVVVIGDPSLICQASYDLIPGFQLVDRSFVLRCDSTGHNPKSDLWRELLPMLKSMLAGNAGGSGKRAN